METTEKNQKESTLIKQKNEFILCSEDEVKNMNEWYIDDANELRCSITDDKDYWSRRTDYKKVIAHTNHPELPKINFNGLDKEFGYVDVEKLAMDSLKEKWQYLYKFGYPKIPFPTNYAEDLFNISKGFQLSQSLNENMFSEEDLRNALKEVEHITQRWTNPFLGSNYAKMEEETEAFIVKLKQPKQWKVLVEEENGMIKIVKKL